ncbi:uncharacterized protein LOC106090556 [Stomoxys calcitrans]|uniref:Uncharacterized protein n=1 Tax=Stomoxys calcitrans TaxID=35570 RepID=A0A1I8QDK7_STOCA|nr:uncharacterized protein LOC106090556 [Stomoxys calcitrans]
MSNSDRSSRAQQVSFEKSAAEDGEEGGIKDPKPLPYLFEKELINNSNRHIYVVDDFVPSRNIHHVDKKFYARHQQSEPENQTYYRSFVERQEMVQHRTSNNVYGWMPPSLKGTRLLSQLNFVSAPKQRGCLTVYGEIVQSDRITERPPFNGLRFYLQ